MKRIIVIFFVQFVLTGCIGTKYIETQKFESPISGGLAFELKNTDIVSESGLAEFSKRLEAELKRVGRYDVSSNLLVRVNLKNYFMRNSGARLMGGVLAGIDNIQSLVEVVDKASGVVLGAFEVESENATALGSEAGLIQQHVKKIVSTVQKNSN